MNHARRVAKNGDVRIVRGDDRLGGSAPRADRLHERADDKGIVEMILGLVEYDDPLGMLEDDREHRGAALPHLEERPVRVSGLGMRILAGLR